MWEGGPSKSPPFTIYPPEKKKKEERSRRGDEKENTRLDALRMFSVFASTLLESLPHKGPLSIFLLLLLFPFSSPGVVVFSATILFIRGGRGEKTKSVSYICIYIRGVFWGASEERKGAREGPDGQEGGGENNRRCECKACQADCWAALLYQTCRSRAPFSYTIRRMDGANKHSVWKTGLFFFSNTRLVDVLCVDPFLLLLQKARHKANLSIHDLKSGKTTR